MGRVKTQPVLRAHCSACGVEAGCDCNAPYVPAREAAAVAVAANPGLSSRSIAKKTGIPKSTLIRAKATDPDGSVGNVVQVSNS